MSDLPASVHIVEEGPREGFQFEKGAIPTDRKIALIELVQDIQIDIVRFKRASVLLEIIRTQPLAKVAHAVGSQPAGKRALAPL